MHFNRLYFNCDIDRSKGGHHARFENTSLHLAHRDGSNTTNFVHILKGQAQRLVSGTSWWQNAIQSLEQGGTTGTAAFTDTSLEMSCTIEKALADAKALVERLRDHDDAAESLIEQTTALNKRVEAMKQYQEEIQELNEVARHRPRSTLVMGIQQENRQIRELQQENKELRTSLEEHQSALELIMSKYREQMFRLLMASKRDDPGIIMKLKEQHSKELQAHVDQITEMAAVMRKAIEIDEKQGCQEQERIFQLEQENKGLREILQITRESFLNLRKEDVSDSTSLSALVTSSDLSLRKS
ncbi:FGFR1 oncogene partner 2 isoform X2 [Dipodomys spectabilis]|uniref:FGFR1 oncogene partner 2 isoform X2 n=1 Tax=Dipodomys spectabilis TaxID=105255 RepID=UPI001C536D1C|nr:FGFR1 oncogene partner 2 isoform X2 [Dipodomys spectabilis]